MQIMQNIIDQDFEKNLSNLWRYKYEKKNSVNSEAVVRRCFVKKLLLDSLQNSQENTCARDSF